MRKAPYSCDKFRALGFPGAVEMANTFQYNAESAEWFMDDRDLALVLTLNPELQSFRDWLTVHKDEIAPV